MKNFKILNTVKEMQVTFYLRYCRREMEIIVTGLPPPQKNYHSGGGKYESLMG